MSGRATWQGHLRPYHPRPARVHERGGQLLAHGGVQPRGVAQDPGPERGRGDVDNGGGLREEPRDQAAVAPPRPFHRRRSGLGPGPDHQEEAWGRGAEPRAPALHGRRGADTQAAVEQPGRGRADGQQAP